MTHPCHLPSPIDSLHPTRSDPSWPGIRSSCPTWRSASARDRFHGTIGAGAYDGATALRPGVYFGLSRDFGAFQVTGHLGFHGALDRFSGTVVNLDARLALTGALPLGPSTRLEVGAATGGQPWSYTAASPSPCDAATGCRRGGGRDRGTGAGW